MIRTEKQRRDYAECHAKALLRTGLAQPVVGELLRINGRIEARLSPCMRMAEFHGGPFDPLLCPCRTCEAAASRIEVPRASENGPARPS